MVFFPENVKVYIFFQILNYLKLLKGYVMDWHPILCLSGLMSSVPGLNLEIQST